jgi:hypothetical protein
MPLPSRRARQSNRVIRPLGPAPACSQKGEQRVELLLSYQCIIESTRLATLPLSMAKRRQTTNPWALFASGYSIERAIHPTGSARVDCLVAACVVGSSASTGATVRQCSADHDGKSCKRSLSAADGHSILREWLHLSGSISVTDIGTAIRPFWTTRDSHRHLDDSTVSAPLWRLLIGAWQVER